MMDFDLQAVLPQILPGALACAEVEAQKAEQQSVGLGEFDQIGLLGPGMVGLTLGYSIFIVRGHLSLRLLSHEYRHVHQYETGGSIASFVAEYLQQIALCGYGDAPLERDAKAHELSDQRSMWVN
jgi:hypothetical protein